MINRLTQTDYGKWGSEWGKILITGGLCTLQKAFSWRSNKIFSFRRCFFASLKKKFGLFATNVKLRCTGDTYLVIVKKKTQKAQSKTDIKNSDKLANIYLYYSHFFHIIFKIFLFSKQLFHIICMYIHNEYKLLGWLFKCGFIGLHKNVCD